MSKTKIVGILNVTPDSFSDGGKFDSKTSALDHLRKMLLEGADMIDIGAESTRPTATAISTDEEWRRLANILPEIIAVVKKFNAEKNKKILTSIDSYHFENLKKSYEFGVDIINDVKGLADERIVDFIAEKNITTILMHSAPIPVNPDLVINPHLNVTAEILNFAREKIYYLQKKGVKKSQLIFDPGIGFNKNALQSIRILKNIEAFRTLGIPLYIGHSKKSFLEEVKIKNATRAEKTLIISKYLAQKNVEFLRVHDVAENKATVA
jgi:dihydropteroate synthase